MRTDRLAGWVAALALLLGCGGGRNQPRPEVSFQKVTSLSVNGIRTSLAAADFDGDGHLDIAAASDSGRLTVFGGRGDGSFAQRQQIQLGTTAAIVAGDMDGNGAADVVLARPDRTELVVLLGQLGGMLGAPVAHMISNVLAPTNVPLVLRDVDRDGRIDVVAAGISNVTIHRNMGDGTLMDMGTYAFPYPDGIALADLDGDGWDDLVVSGTSGSGVFLRGPDATTFSSPTELAGGGGPAVADLDDDGDLDVVFTNAFLSVHVNDGRGHLQLLTGRDPEALVTRTFYVSGTVVADLDGDGRQDLALSTTSNPGLLMGTDDRWFQLGPDLPEAHWSIAAADFDEDGRVDLAAAYPVPPEVHVLVNRTR